MKQLSTINKTSKKNEIVLLAVACEATNMLYHYLKQYFTITKVIVESPIPKTTLVRRRAKRFGYVKALGQVAFQLSIVPFLRWKSQNRLTEIYQQYNLQKAELPIDKIINISSINSKQARRLLRELSPKIVVINGTRIISRKTLRATNAHFINMHVGITPLYRGVHGGYWALANRQPQHCGVSIHLVDTGIDTGGILAQTRIQPSEKDNFVTYPILQFAEGLPLLQKAITETWQGELVTLTPPKGESNLWLHPTIWEYFYNYWKTGTI